MGFSHYAISLREDMVQVLGVSKQAEVPVFGLNL